MIRCSFMPAANGTQRCAHQGFTLTELMAVIAIIAILVGIVLVSMKSLRHAGLQTAQLNDLRQIAVAWRSYSDDNDARLLPGYIGADLMDPGGGQIFSNLKVTTPSGQPVLPDDAQAYVWRLTPYMSENWGAFFAGLRDSSVTAILQSEYSANKFGPGSIGPGDIGISERPAYGINAIFLGGDSVHGGDYATSRNPWNPTLGLEDEILAATRMAQVKNPAKIIVAAPTALALNDGDLTDVYDTGVIGSGITNDRVGYAELRPPYTELDLAQTEWVEEGRWWRVGRGGEIRRIAGMEYGAPPDPSTGLPIHRVKPGFLPVVMVDGSTSVENTAELSRDMTRWCPSEVARRPTMPAGLDPPD